MGLWKCQPPACLSAWHTAGQLLALAAHGSSDHRTALLSSNRRERVVCASALKTEHLCCLSLLQSTTRWPRGFLELLGISGLGSSASAEPQDRQGQGGKRRWGTEKPEDGGPPSSQALGTTVADGSLRVGRKLLLLPGQLWHLNNDQTAARGEESCLLEFKLFIAPAICTYLDDKSLGFK